MSNSLCMGLFVLLLSLAIGGCSKRSVYQSLIEHERSKAKLVLKTQLTSYGKVSYLTNSTTSQVPVVMLHGFGGEKDNWNRFSQKLTGSYRLIIPDLPGHGESVQNLAWNYGIEEQTARLRRFLDSLGIKKAHLVGNSMGGAIVIRYASLYPQSVASLTLIAPAGVATTPSEFDALVKKTGTNPFLEVKDDAGYRAMMNYLFVNPPYIPGFVIDVLVDEKLKRKPTEQKMFHDMVADMDQSRHLAAIHAPTLILWGAQDRVLHVANAEVLQQKISGSRKVILEATGHCPMIEKPEQSSQVFAEFMRQIKGL